MRAAAATLPACGVLVPSPDTSDSGKLSPDLRVTPALASAGAGAAADAGRASCAAFAAPSGSSPPPFASPPSCTTAPRLPADTLRCGVATSPPVKNALTRRSPPKKPASSSASSTAAAMSSTGESAVEAPTTAAAVSSAGSPAPPSTPAAEAREEGSAAWRAEGAVAPLDSRRGDDVKPVGPSSSSSSPQCSPYRPRLLPMASPTLPASAPSALPSLPSLPSLLPSLPSSPLLYHWRAAAMSPPSATALSASTGVNEPRADSTKASRCPSISASPECMSACSDVSTESSDGSCAVPARGSLAAG